MHARAANVHVTTAPKEARNPKWISFSQATKRKIHQIIILKNGTFVCIFPGQEIKKKIRNARASLAPAQRDETPTELAEPFVINVHPASEGKCLHFLT